MDNVDVTETAVTSVEGGLPDSVQSTKVDKSDGGGDKILDGMTPEKAPEVHVKAKSLRIGGRLWPMEIRKLKHT